MIKNDNNNPKEWAKPFLNFNSLVEQIDRSSWPAARRSECRSAVVRVARITGDGTMDQAVNLQKVFSDLAKLSPAMVGVSTGGYANLKSRFRASFKLAKAEVVTVRNVRLNDDWQPLRDTLPKRDALTLSQFMRFCTFYQYVPGDICDAHIQRYRSFICDAGATEEDADKVIRAVVRCWNTLAPTLPTEQLSLPASKRTSYWVSRDNWVPSLNVEVDEFLASLNPSGALKKSKAAALKPATVAQYEIALITVVSALVARGHNLKAMQSLKQVVTSAQVEQAVEFLVERRGEKVTAGMATLTARCRKAATWCGLPEEIIDEFSDLLERIDISVDRDRAMTPKNQALIDRLDDRRFRDLVLLLPFALMQQAKKSRDGRSAPGTARTAVAIELLLACSMRRANLASLRLGENIKKLGSGKDSRWVIEFEAADVKNGQPLRFILPEDTAQLLEEYLENWRHNFCTQPNSWLFPDPEGGPTNARSLAASITTLSRRALGVPITPHQFRHLSAAIFVGDDPNKVATASEHLGHASVDTTRRYYLKSQQKSATRVYQRHLGLDRARALERTKVRVRRHRPPTRLNKGDEL